MYNKYKKIAILILTATISIGLLPAHSAAAQSTASEEITTIAEPSGGEQPVTTPAVSEQTTTEQPAATPTNTEQPTTEPSVTTPAATSEFIKSTLSPVKAKTIVLDPGHCETHRGASYGNMCEEVIVLDFAKACKKYLDQYGDINVYMTRTTNACSKSIAPGDCLIARNYYSKLLSADFLISMHIDYDKGSGAKILVPYKSGFNDLVRQKSRAFGKNVLKELANIGFKNDGFLLRRSSKYSRYKNGKRTDYYSIVRNGVLLNVPSVIIEHGFLNRATDRNKYFKTQEQRAMVGTADAKAIVSYFNLTSPVINGKLTKIGKATYYITDTSQKVTGWVKHNGSWYYFDETTGKMKTGFVTIGKNTFYLKPSTGKMASSWFKVNGVKYLSRGNGTLVKNQKYSDGYYTYKFNAKGKYVKRMKN